MHTCYEKYRTKYKYHNKPLFTDIPIKTVITLTYEKYFPTREKLNYCTTNNFICLGFKQDFNTSLELTLDSRTFCKASILKSDLKGM